MNRKITPYLIGATLILALLAYLSERPRRDLMSGASRMTEGGGGAIIDVRQSEITRVRMKKDFWNSYLLVKASDGKWMLEEPMREPADLLQVNVLLEMLTTLPRLHVLDMPGDDSQRRSEYGLWEPSLEMTLSTGAGAMVLLFGDHTPDNSGVYVTVHGDEHIYVTSEAAYQVLRRDVTTYRPAP
ncbi:MAG: DUF4340 domain-containing protein [Spartobacteria bacterium]|nr:DUF4340 domain-containing protein [Spartobacteria bacterium]